MTDAQVGNLIRHRFGRVLRALFGIPLGRLADVWARRSMISLGLAFWSVMTALSGTAKAFRALLGFRIGVGIGEASATPAALSMLSDYFSPKRRATVMAIYSSGVYIGGGIGVAIGGIVLDGGIVLVSLITRRRPVRVWQGVGKWPFYWWVSLDS